MDRPSLKSKGFTWLPGNGHTNNKRIKRPCLFSCDPQISRQHVSPYFFLPSIKQALLTFHASASWIGLLPGALMHHACFGLKSFSLRGLSAWNIVDYIFVHIPGIATLVQVFFPDHLFSSQLSLYKYTHKMLYIHIRCKYMCIYVIIKKVCT